jgi:arylsulfatase A-like enzyme
MHHGSVGTRISIAELDYRVGQIVDCVDAAGIANNTIIVFSCDNAAGLMKI